MAIGHGLLPAAALGPDLVTDASGPVRALGSFGLILLFGGVLLNRRRALVERSIDAVIDGPKVAVVYGLLSYAVVLAVGFYGVSQLGRVGVAGTPLGIAGLAAIGAVVMLLTGFGFLVVGTLLTDLQGQRDARYGLVVGAAMSAVGWLVLPLLGGLAVWVVVAAFGIGGSARKYFHAERTVEAEVER